MPETQPTIEIIEDGRVLRGGEWILPSDYIDDDDAAGLLPSWKGATPSELPSLPATAEGW